MLTGVATFPVNRGIDELAVATDVNGHSIDEAADDFLAVGVGGCVGTPQLTNVERQRANPLSVAIADDLLSSLLGTVVFILQIAFCAERLFPLRFQRGGDESIGGIHRAVTALRQFHVVASSFQFLLPLHSEAPLLLLQVGYRCEAQFQGGRSQSPQHLGANHFIYRCRLQAEAIRFCSGDEMFVAVVVADVPPAITDLHPPAAGAADDESCQQR